MHSALGDMMISSLSTKSRGYAHEPTSSRRLELEFKADQGIMLAEANAVKLADLLILVASIHFRRRCDSTPKRGLHTVSA